MRYRNTEYMITNQRVVTQTGAIGMDTRFVKLNNVQEVYVT
ncbi:MAG: PH domain-containing protein [Candidatus Bathyarchaeales archaeon]